MEPAPDPAPPFVPGQGDPRLSEEQKAQLAAIAGSDELQEALDEVGRRYPELSNDNSRDVDGRTNLADILCGTPGAGDVDLRLPDRTDRGSPAEIGEGESAPVRLTD